MQIDVSVLLPIIGALVAVVNIVTQVLKKVTWDKLPTNILVLLLSVALTVAAFFAYAQITALAVTWYMVAAAVVAGFAVAYAAMFGFDKLRETFNSIK